MIRVRLQTSARPFLLLLVAGGLFYGCQSPLDIDTPRHETGGPSGQTPGGTTGGVSATTHNLFPAVTDPQFINAPGDAVFATIDGEMTSFSAESERPTYNGYLNGDYYASVYATSYRPTNSLNYESVSLRIDAIADTGTYPINGPYSIPKQIDPNLPSTYGALYQRKNVGGAPETYRTGLPGTGGEIHVVKIDRKLHVVVGTFWFIGYSTELQKYLRIDNGAFRLQMTD
jgi:hypothetical protein